MAKDDKKLKVYISDFLFKWKDNGSQHEDATFSWALLAGNEINIERMGKKKFRLRYLGAEYQKNFDDFDAAKAFAFDFARQVLLDMTKIVNDSQLKYEQELKDRDN